MRIISFYLITLITTFSCQQAKNPSVTTRETEKEINQNSLKTQITALENQPIYPFKYNNVAGYNFNSSVEEIRNDDKLFNQQKTSTFEYKGNISESPYIEISDNSGKLFDINYDEREAKPLITEFEIRSERMKNPENIGVGNTLNDFFDAYPNANINYSLFKNGFLYLENGYKGYQFIIETPKDFFDRVDKNSIGLTNNFDRNFFSGQEKITSIRIFSGLLKEDIEGIWTSEDKTVTATLKKNNELYAIELSLDETNPKKISQDLVPFRKLLYSPPTEKNYIEVQTYGFPHSITLNIYEDRELEPFKIELYPQKEL